MCIRDSGSTTREGVFAGGDAVMGARTVVEAVAIAKKVAEDVYKRQARWRPRRGFRLRR